MSPDRAPEWTESFDAVLFGIHEAKKKKDADKPEAGEAKAGTEAAPAAPKKDEEIADEDIPDLVIWHGQDRRLQSQQQVQEQRDKTYSYLAEYRIAEKTFIRLADDDLRYVERGPQADGSPSGQDNRAYELDTNLIGRRLSGHLGHRHEDGQADAGPQKERVLFRGPLRRVPLPLLRRRPLLHVRHDHGQVRHHHQGRPRFVRRRGRRPQRRQAAGLSGRLDEGRAERPPLGRLGHLERPRQRRGQGRQPDRERGQGQAPLPPPAARSRGEGDRSRPAAVLQRLRRMDQEGRDRPRRKGQAGPGDAPLGRRGVRRAWPRPRRPRSTSTRGTPTRTIPDYYVADADAPERPAADRGQPAAEGLPLVERLDAPRLQERQGRQAPGAPCSSRPTTKRASATRRSSTIYEKMSQQLNRYAQPSANGFNKSVYTSNGYAVLIPDITYKINDPGMSAVWCVLPAIDAAVAAGVVDRAKVGLQGHSWGGYQTAFLVTQAELRRGRGRGAADQHDQHVQLHLLQLRLGQPAHLRDRARAGSRAAIGTTSKPTSGTRPSITPRRSRRRSSSSTTTRTARSIGTRASSTTTRCGG